MRTPLCLMSMGLVVLASCFVNDEDWIPPRKSDPLVVLQRTDSDCGVAALATLFGLFTIDKDYEDLTGNEPVGRYGLSMQALVNMAERHGVGLQGYSFTDIGRTGSVSRGLPWIALLGSGANGHYVVVRSIVADTVFVLDPRAGSRSIKRGAFEDIWTGYGLLVNQTTRSPSGADDPVFRPMQLRETRQPG